MSQETIKVPAPPVPVRTVSVVTRRQTATDRLRDRSVAADTRRLLDGSTVRRDIAAHDVDHSLLESASAVLTQLMVLGDLCRGADATQQIILGIVDLAESFRTASPGAIGASGVLVDHLRAPDAARLAAALESIHGAFDDDDLIAGATALLAATTSYLADALGEPPITVHDEVHRAMSVRRRGRSDRNRFCLRALGRRRVVC